MGNRRICGASRTYTAMRTRIIVNTGAIHNKETGGDGGESTEAT